MRKIRRKVILVGSRTGDPYIQIAAYKP
eukprot:SAG31_NODE_37628_length_302_cov_1.527094_1_plen_27_part_01